MPYEPTGPNYGPKRPIDIGDVIPVPSGQLAPWGMIASIRHGDASGCPVRGGGRARARASAPFTSRMVATDSVPR